MSELLALRAPYSDILKTEDNEEGLTWTQIVAATHLQGTYLRPTRKSWNSQVAIISVYLFCLCPLFLRTFAVPADINSDMRSLVEECWADDQALRPSFNVIVSNLVRCFGRVQLIHQSAKMKQNLVDLQDMREFCRSLHDLLWIVKEGNQENGPPGKPWP